LDPFGNGKTAIRAGWGLFYAATIANLSSNLQGQPFLVDTTVNVTPNLNTPYANVPGGSPFPYALNRQNPLFSLPITAGYISEGLGMPYVMQYNFTVKRAVAISPLRLRFPPLHSRAKTCSTTLLEGSASSSF
jgi:hypothetical protein